MLPARLIAAIGLGLGSGSGSWALDAGPVCDTRCFTFCDREHNVQQGCDPTSCQAMFGKVCNCAPPPPCPE